MAVATNLDDFHRQVIRETLAALRIAVSSADQLSKCNSNAFHVIPFLNIVFLDLNLVPVQQPTSFCFFGEFEIEISIMI